VVSRNQLLAVGVPPTTIGERVRSGRLIRLHRGVYAVGHARLRKEGHWLAAVLAVGPRAVLSHRDAAGLHGLRPANHVRTDVTTTRQPRAIDGIAIHRTRVLDVEQVTTVSGIPVTTVPRTLVDLAGTVPRDHLAKAIKEAERRRTFDLGAIEVTLARTRGRRGPGHRALREAIAEHVALGLSATDSALEDAFLRLVRSHGLSLPATNALIEGFRVDAAWRAHRIVVELDGWQHHHTRHAFERDRERDAALTAAGWHVVRFTYRQVTARPDSVIQTLRRLGIS
jgi:very-short-patch-repair endonuclease